jgi:thiamine biosynthesis lipoprotein
LISNLAQARLSKSYQGLGTVIDLTIFGSQDESLLFESHQLIQHYEKLFTVNRTASEVLSISDKAGIEPVQVSSAVYSLVKKATETSLEHFGFNVAIGPLVKLWHIGFKDARVPTDEEMSQKMQLISPENIRLNQQDQSVFLEKSGMELDLGAIAKGYIADRISDFWKSRAVQSGIINLGGNLLLLGEAAHQADKKWRVGIRNPLLATDETIAILTTGASSVVTSGISERTFTAGGKTYHHIINPETGYPHETEIVSVTVLTEASIEGEIETTRLFFAETVPKNYNYSAIIAYRDKSLSLVNFDEKNIQITNSEFYIKEIL